MIPEPIIDIFHFSNYVRHPLKLKEGNLTIIDTVGSKGDDENHTLTNQMRIGEPVKLVTDERKTVEQVDDYDDDIILGLVHTKPEFVEGYIPMEDLTYGNYPNRKASIMINAKAFKTFKVVEGNAEIKLGDKIKVVGAERNRWTKEMDLLVDKGTKDNETYAITEVPADTPDSEVDVLFEFKPLNGV